MVEPTARIRVFEASDDKLVRFTIGKANMEGLAVANRRAYMHPWVLSAWIAASCIFIQIMNWWPESSFGWWGYLRPVPAFGSMAFPFMFLIDWLNRPYFEDVMQDILHRPDIANIKSYYSRSPSSGFWILNYGDQFIGLIAVDSSLDSTSNEPLRASEKLSVEKGTSSVARIRHFYVEEDYRRIGIQNDLLTHALRHTFHSSATVKRITAVDSPLAPYLRESLRGAGFHLEEHTEKVGVFGWKLGTRLLERDTWEKAHK